VKECAERKIRLGLTKKPKVVFDEVDQTSAAMVREGWSLVSSCVEEGLGYIHLFFEREIEL
jgi:hypothetical protein